MPPNSQTPDLVVLFTALLALAFSPSLSAILAPYAVIVVGALLGTGWGLKRRAADATGPWGFVALMMGTALVFTMPAAVWLQQYLGPASWFLAPIAATIAAIGDDWPRVGTWLAEVARRIINRKADSA